jgi:hypothetical protein
VTELVDYSVGAHYINTGTVKVGPAKQWYLTCLGCGAREVFVTRTAFETGVAKHITLATKEKKTMTTNKTMTKTKVARP